jgi:hypothetical protein
LFKGLLFGAVSLQRFGSDAGSWRRWIALDAHCQRQLLQAHAATIDLKRHASENKNDCTRVHRPGKFTRLSCLDYFLGCGIAK